LSIAGLAIALLVQLPWRLYETEAFVRPFAAANEFIRSRKEMVVVVHGDRIWYGRDLVRNDPFLAQPIVIRASLLAPGAIPSIERTFPGRVLDLGDADLLRLGMTPVRGPN
jgi:hypothetical protein